MLPVEATRYELCKIEYNSIGRKSFLYFSVVKSCRGKDISQPSLQILIYITIKLHWFDDDWNERNVVCLRFLASHNDESTEALFKGEIGSR